jgi:hypothetical protein
MSELLSATDKANFQTSILDIFDTFQKAIKIHKEAIRKIVTVNSDSTLPGYNESSDITNYELTPVSKDFYALVNYNRRQETGVADEVGIVIPEGQVMIKVQQEARDYIMNGKTERIEFDGKSFNLISRDSVRDYFGMKIYIFVLEEVV